MPTRAKGRAQPGAKKSKRPQLRLDRFLPHRLSVLSNTVSRAISDEYAERFGLSISEWRVIAVLQYFPGASSGELAERSGMDNVAVSRAVNHLLRSGLITRDLSSADRRRTILNLSKLGNEVYDEITPLALQYERNLLRGLDKMERQQLDILLNKILVQAQQFGTKL